MKPRFILLTLVMFSVLSSLSFALTCTTCVDGMVIYLDMEQSGTNLTDLIDGDDNASVQGNESLLNKVNYFIDSARNKSSTSEEEHIFLNNSARINSLKNYTISFWFNYNGGGDNYARIFSKGDGIWDIYRDNGGTNFVHRANGGTVSFTMNTNTDYLVTITRLFGQNISVYLNGSIVASTTASTSGDIGNANDFYFFRNFPPSTDNIPAFVDEFFISNRSMTEQEVSDLYQDYLNGERPTDAQSNISLVAPTLSNNTYINNNYTYINASSNFNITSCYAEFNGTNESMTVTASWCYLNKTDLADGNYTFKVHANFSGTWINTDERLVILDNVVPAITWYNPTTDISIQTNFTINVSIYDLNLDAVNVTLLDSVLSEVWYYENTSLDISNISLELPSNLSNGPQVYTLVTCGVDSVGDANTVCENFTINYFDNPISLENHTVDPFPSYWNDVNITTLSNNSGFEYEFYYWFKDGILINNSEFSYCYQGYANLSASCGGLPTGTYAFPGDYFYINYTKPFGATNDSLWQVKHGNFNTYNISLPDSCWYESPYILQLRIFSDGSYSAIDNVSSQPQCYNGTGWEDVGNLSTSSTPNIGNSFNDFEYHLTDEDYGTQAAYAGGWKQATLEKQGAIYEEAMYWMLLESNKTLYTDFYSTFENITSSIFLVNGSFFINSNFSTIIQPGNFSNLSIQNAYNLTHLFNYNVTYDYNNINIINRQWLSDGVNILNDSDIIGGGNLTINANLTFIIEIENNTNEYYNFSTSAIVNHPLYLANGTFNVSILNQSGTDLNFSVDMYLTLTLGIDDVTTVDNNNIWFVWWKNGVELIKGWGLNVINFFFEVSEEGENTITVNATTNPNGSIGLWSNSVSWTINVTKPTLEPSKVEPSNVDVYDSIVITCSHNFTGHIWYYDIDVNVTNSTGDTFWVNATTNPTLSGLAVFDLTPYNNSPNYQVRCRTWNEFFNYSNYTYATNIVKKSKNDIKLYHKLQRPLARGLNSFSTKCEMDKNTKYRILYHWHDTNGDQVWERLESYTGAQDVNLSSYGFDTNNLIKDNITISTGCRIEKRTTDPWEFPDCDEKYNYCDIQKKYNMEVLI